MSEELNYISEDQFLEQSKEVQNFLINWWQPKIGDLLGIKIRYINSSWNTITKYKVSCISEEDIFNYDSKEELLNSFKTIGEHNYSDKVIPLQTETKLRKFIEEKSGKIESIGITGHDYSIATFIQSYGIDYAEDLLQAYWQVACKIAEDIINKDQV